MRRERRPDVRNRAEGRPCSRGTHPVPIATEFGLQGRMDILSSADVGPLLLAGLSLASFVTAFISVFTGAAGGVILLAIMAMVMPPAAVIPVHTIVMLGTGISRTLIMWRFVMHGTVLPFIVGSAVGAAAGAKVFVALPISWLQAILGAFILLVTWMPQLGRIGARRGRFAVLGFGAVFLGVFVSATGTLLAPFIASAAPDRYSLAATMGALMTITHRKACRLRIHRV